MQDQKDLTEHHSQILINTTYNNICGWTIMQFPMIWFTITVYGAVCKYAFSAHHLPTNTHVYTRTRTHVNNTRTARTICKTHTLYTYKGLGVNIFTNSEWRNHGIPTAQIYYYYNLVRFPGPLLPRIIILYIYVRYNVIHRRGVCVWRGLSW